MFIRIAAYHVQQTRLGLLAAESDDDTNEAKQKEDAIPKVDGFNGTIQEDAIMNQIKVV